MKKILKFNYNVKMKNKSPLFIMHYTLYILLIITLLSCTTSPQSGSLSGTILLDGQEDHSAITVALYELSELDPDIVAINQEYDFIGVIINQTTEFDHRFGNLIKSSTTNTDGSFEIKDITTGKYNFMAMKDSFGFKYIYEISITEGENALTEQSKKEKGKSKKVNIEENNSFNLLPLIFNLNKSEADIILYPVTHISSDIDTSTTWNSWQNYIIENDIFVNGALTIKPGAVIRIEKDKKLTISGDLTAVGNEDNFIWFTSNDSIIHYSLFIVHSLPKEDIAPYNRIELSGNSDKQVAWCKFEYAGTGLLNNVNGFSISDCIFKNSNCGFKVENVDSAFCSNLLCQDITNESEGGIYFNQVNNGLIEKAILYNCYNGIKVKSYSNPEINNNFLIDNNNGIFLGWFVESEISHNNFKDNEWAINMIVRSEPEIYYNDIIGENGILLGHGPQTYDQNQPTINHNNLNVADLIIKLDSTNDLDIDATCNYFFTIDSEEISEKIIDYYDYINNPGTYEYGKVFFEPFMTYEISNCGIE